MDAQVVTKQGYYFLDRIAIPNMKADGTMTVWYINNPMDKWYINKASKWWRKMHLALSNNVLPPQIASYALNEEQK